MQLHVLCAYLVSMVGAPERPSLLGTRDGPFWGEIHEMTLFLEVRSCKSRVWSTWSQVQTTDVMVISLKEINTSYAHYAL